jgi:hypothetical protein
MRSDLTGKFAALMAVAFAAGWLAPALQAGRQQTPARAPVAKAPAATSSRSAFEPAQQKAVADKCCVGTALGVAVEPYTKPGEN